MTAADERFMSLADNLAQWSQDPSTKTGAVVVHDRQVRGAGFNGFPPGINDSDERYADRTLKYKLIVHAETCAILDCTEIVAGGTLYSTVHPCTECAKLILLRGITRVVYRGRNPRWTGDTVIAEMMFREARVRVERFTE